MNQIFDQLDELVDDERVVLVDDFVEKLRQIVFVEKVLFFGDDVADD